MPYALVAGQMALMALWMTLRPPRRARP
jgi:hypothetical protein